MESGFGWTFFGGRTVGQGPVASQICMIGIIKTSISFSSLNVEYNSWTLSSSSNRGQRS